MIGPAEYVAFLGVSLLVICTPGQDTALTIRNTLLGDRGTGAATALGVASGQATWTAATAAGLAVLLTASAPLFFAIRLAGAAYLIYLGARSLAGAISRRENFEIEAAKKKSASMLSARAAFAQGLVSNLSNPKMVAFFVGLLPPFAGPHPGFAILLLLGLNFCFLTLAWLMAYAFAVERLGGWLRRSRLRRSLDAILGAVLLGLGVRVTTEALAG